MGAHRRIKSTTTTQRTTIIEALIEFEGPSAFDNLLRELGTLNVKYLQQLLSDLNKNGAIPPFYGDYHRMLVNFVESNIIERTILK